MSERKITLLLIGKTGSGKSATGNYILFKQNEPFETGDGGHSITKEISVKDGDIDGVHVTVIDSAGVLDTDMNVDMDKQVACENMTKAFLRCPKNSKIVLALVYKYLERFTAENKLAINTLKAIFGEDFIKKYCIIIITNGDKFKRKYKGTKRLEEWCKEQRGPFGELLHEAEHRCILFDNCTEEEPVKMFQLSELKRCVEQIDSSYSHEIFEQAKRNHPRLYLEAKLPSLREKYRELLLNLQSETHNIDRYNENADEKLLALKEEVLKLRARIMKQEKKANYTENDFSPFTNEKEEIDCLCRLLEDNITHSKMFKISNECKDKINTLFEATARFDMEKSDENELDKMLAILQNTMSSYKKSMEIISSTVDVIGYTAEVYKKEKQLQNKIEYLKIQSKQIKVIAGFKAKMKSIEHSLSNIPVEETDSTDINDVCLKVAKLLDELKEEKERSKEPQVKTPPELTEDDTENKDTSRDPLDDLIEQVNSLQQLSLEKKEKIKSNLWLEIIGAVIEVGSSLLGVAGTVAAASKPFAQGTAKVVVKVASKALTYSAPIVKQTGKTIIERIREKRQSHFKRISSYSIPKADPGLAE